MVSKSKQINLNSLVDNLSVGVYRRTPGLLGRFIYANNALLEMLGYRKDEIFKIKVADLFDNKEKFKESNAGTFKDGKLNNEEVRLLGKNQEPVWCSVSSVVVYDKKGNPKWIDGIIEDITVQKKVERDLRESKELFRTVFNNSASAITVTDKDERIIAWNPFAEEMLGMDKTDLFNKPVKDLYPAEEWRRLRSMKIRKKGASESVDAKVCRKDGKLLDVNMSISVLKDMNDNVTGSIGIMRDITKQKSAENNLRESEAKIRAIFDNSPIAITMADEQENIISWNTFTEKLLGKNKDDLYMRPVSSLYPKDEWDRILLESLKKRTWPHHLETKVLAKEGRHVDINLAVNVLKDDSGKVIGSVGIMQDITQQKNNEQALLEAKLAAEEASKGKSLFLANMSHEVRTPMNTVLGMLDITLDTDLTEEQRENLKNAKDAADNLLSLLNDILDLSRVEAGKINLERIEINLHNIVKSVCKGMELLAKKKDLELAWELDETLPQFLVGDPVRIRQILVNLINNAVKFTFKGKIQVKVKVSSMSETECEVLFSVADEGIGISKDKKDKIFETFSQADDSTTRKYGGTGLGLAICKRLIEVMGGNIWVESEDLKGSTFYFTAKLKIIKKKDRVPPEEESAGMGEEKKGSPRVENISILLAEDNIVNQKIAAKLLEKRGWFVKAVDNGQKVLDLLEKENFDLILMDAQMPVMDGFEATRMIRQSEQQTGGRIPIVALTARAMADDKKKCLEAGMDGYVSKPIDRENLYESIESAVNQGRDNE